jgi:hypothetical protein
MCHSIQHGSIRVSAVDTWLDQWHGNPPMQCDVVIKVQHFQTTTSFLTLLDRHNSLARRRRSFRRCTTRYNALTSESSASIDSLIHKGCVDDSYKASVLT